MIIFLGRGLIFLMCVLVSEQQPYPQKTNTQRYGATKLIPKRLIEVMRSYYEQGHARVKAMNLMRFMYEESPHYESGYVMSEIIERYRKVVEHTQRPHKFVFEHIFDLVKRVELVQRFYFEIYHLVCMMHEIPVKYKGVGEFAGGIGKPEEKLSDDDLNSLNRAQAHLAELERRRKKDAKKKKKMYDKMRFDFLQGLSSDFNPKMKYPGSSKGYVEGEKLYKPWPLEYGWEIDYKW